MTDKEKEQKKQWYAKHRNEKLTYEKNYYIKNKEKILSYRKSINHYHTYQKKWRSSTVASIYKITNLKNGKIYIGSTTMNPKMRWLTHISAMKVKSHRPLYKDMLQLGIENFTFDILITCQKNQARQQEQLLIDSWPGELYNKIRAVRKI